MILKYAHDGQKASREELIRLGFDRQLLEGRDYRVSVILDGGDGASNLDLAFSFVGFVTNSNNDSLVVFPKHYRVENIESDAGMIFRLIFDHIQKHPHLYIGENKKGHYETNFPFAAFFSVYDYYKKYGLYTEIEHKTKEGTKGRLDWKTIIKKSQKVIHDDVLLMLPLYYREKRQYDTFLSECMAYVISYTADKFGYLLGIKKTEIGDYSRNLLNDKSFVLNYLHRELMQSFTDAKITLINGLIDFFSGINIGGSYYLKHYSFNLIWEDVALHYLRDHFVGVDPEDRSLILSTTKVPPTPFSKEAFRPNAAKKTQKIEPDYYFISDGAQYIFDAKYYLGINELDYKQLVYCLLLSNREGADASYNTYSSLILPSESRSAKEHFRLDPSFNKDLPESVIYEEYLDIKSVVEYHLTDF